MSLEKISQTGSRADQSQSCRTHVTTLQEYRHIHRMHLRIRDTAAATTTLNMAGDDNNRISAETVHIRLRKADLKSRSSYKVAMLTPPTSPFCFTCDLSRWLGAKKLPGVDRSAQTKQHLHSTYTSYTWQCLHHRINLESLI